MTLQELLDRQAVRDVHLRYARGIDRKDGALFRTCWRDDAHLGKTGQPGVQGGDAISDGMGHIHRPAYDGTNHTVGNEYYETHGDVAYAEMYGIAHHVFQREGVTDAFVMGMRYRDTLTRDGDGWRIQRREWYVDWTTGEGILPHHRRSTPDA